jgi:hypothetical protein
MAKIGMGIPPAGPSDLGGPKKHSILDGLITGLFGANTEDMTPATARVVEAERAQDRKAVGVDAAAAANNPEAFAKSFMKAPAIGGSDATPLSLLGDIAKLFKKPKI